jgi:hypothetical protein
MTNIFLNLSGKIEKPVVDTLHILKKVADSSSISDPRTIQIVKEILDAETKEMSQYKLISDMIREAGMSDTRFDGILDQLTKLREGFVEVGEKP